MSAGRGTTCSSRFASARRSALDTTTSMQAMGSRWLTPERQVVLAVLSGFLLIGAGVLLRVQDDDSFYRVNFTRQTITATASSFFRSSGSRAIDNVPCPAHLIPSLPAG